MVLTEAQEQLLSAAEEMSKGERDAETSKHRDLHLTASTKLYAVLKLLQPSSQTPAPSAAATMTARTCGG